MAAPPRLCWFVVTSEADLMAKRYGDIHPHSASSSSGERDRMVSRGVKRQITSGCCEGGGRCRRQTTQVWNSPSAAVCHAHAAETGEGNGRI